ncbi:MAG: YHS domain-containing protein [Bacteroidetes bacterium]|nr:YHS domain-containing protein [Bacteroidota bacterium]
MRIIFSVLMFATAFACAGKEHKAKGGLVPDPVMQPAVMAADTIKPKMAGAKKKIAQPAPPRFANKIDYVCKMDVMSSFTDTCVYGGKVYGFCSGYCRDKFKENPKKYVKN